MTKLTDLPTFTYPHFIRDNHEVPTTYYAILGPDTCLEIQCLKDGNSINEIKSDTYVEELLERLEREILAPSDKHEFKNHFLLTEKNLNELIKF